MTGLFPGYTLAFSALPEDIKRMLSVMCFCFSLVFIFDAITVYDRLCKIHYECCQHAMSWLTENCIHIVDIATFCIDHIVRIIIIIPFT